MNILKAIGALASSPPPPEGGADGQKNAQPQAAQQPPEGEMQDDARANLMAQAIMRHEQIANRVRSRRK